MLEPLHPIIGGVVEQSRTFIRFFKCQFLALIFFFSLHPWNFMLRTVMFLLIFTHFVLSISFPPLSSKYATREELSKLSLKVSRFSTNFAFVIYNIQEVAWYKMRRQKTGISDWKYRQSCQGEWCRLQSLHILRFGTSCTTLYVLNSHKCGRVLLD